MKEAVERTAGGAGMEVVQEVRGEPELALRE